MPRNPMTGNGAATLAVLLISPSSWPDDVSALALRDALRSV